MNHNIARWIRSREVTSCRLVRPITNEAHLLAALILLGIPPKLMGPVATLVYIHDDGWAIGSVTWTEVSLRRRSATTVHVKEARQYNFEIPNCGRIQAHSDRAVASYVVRQDRMGILVIWRDGSQELVPVPGTIWELRFIHEGRELVACRKLKDGHYQSQTYWVRKGLPISMPWGGTGKTLVRTEDQYLGIDQMSPVLRTPQRATDLVSGRFARLIDARNRFVSEDPFRQDRVDYYHPLDVSPNAGYWFENDVRLFHGEGNHDYMVWHKADCLFSPKGLEWQWKESNHTGSHQYGYFFDSKSRFVFLDKSHIVMGRPRDPRNYPAGLYVLDTKTWKPRRHPLSKKLLGDEYEGDLVALREK